MTYWLNVHYMYKFYDVASADMLIVGALGLLLGSGYNSGAGCGQRDLHFPFESFAAAHGARQRLEAASIPVMFETTVSWNEVA